MLQVSEQAAPSFKKVHLEMGGKNVIMIMDDANLELAVEGCLWGGFGTSGQRCTAASRVVVHERVLMLSVDGRRLDGEDSFTPARGELVPAERDQFAVRFHLHSSVKANRLSDGHGAMLAMPNREVWTFTAYGDRVDVEESVYLAGPDGPRRTVQLVIYGRARNVPRVRWTFAPHASRRAWSPASPNASPRRSGSPRNCGRWRAGTGIRSHAC